MRYSGAPHRREELLRRLAGTGYVASHELATALGVSEMTIRRDLRRLHDEGRVQRVVGGASLPAPAAPGAPFEERDARSGVVKHALARAALPVLDGARSVALDAGTTVAALAPSLPAGLTVISHSLPVLAECARRPDLELIGLGGTYVPATRSFAGAQTRAAIADLAVDVLVLAAAAYDEGGLYSTSSLDAEIKRALVVGARRVVLLVDATKAEARAPIRFARLEEVDVVVTDAAPPWLAGPRVVLAGATVGPAR
ncbi:DeoR/GlpR family DNA-binding transcription regulator [Georgenia wangjunii]|uniref:DeoR/GlpR family DNA-binding transcription regulator n=1 Tax=Georgenia wangjunii TaxID=3117730 RepID=UPI002F261A63